MSTPKTVWIAHARVEGTAENFICGVYATQRLAIARCKTWWANENRNFTVHCYSDGDAYLDDETGFRAFLIQRHVVEIPQQPGLSRGQLAANAP